MSQAEAVRAAVDSVHASYRSEVGKLKMQLLLYREALLEAGVEPPDKSADDLLQMYRSCSLVISTASEVVGQLGSAKELLGWKV